MRKLILVAVGLTIGCQCAQKAVVRDAMYNGSKTAWQDTQDWGQQLVAYPIGQTDPRTGQPSDGKNRATFIKPLTPQAYQELQKTHQDYEDFVSKDRANDSAVK